MWTYLGKVIRVGRGWTDAEGVKHPATWNRWTEAEKTAHGLVWDASLQPVAFDNRFYGSAGVEKALDDVDAVEEDGNAILDEGGVQVVTKGLKSNAIAQTKVTAVHIRPYADKAQLPSIGVPDAEGESEISNTVPETVSKYKGS